jgi:hypothetical protein
MKFMYLEKSYSEISKNKTQTGFCKNHLNQNFSTSLLKLFQGKKKKKRFRKHMLKMAKNV